MQDLVVSKQLESMVFNLDLMADSNWAYLGSMDGDRVKLEDVNSYGTFTPHNSHSGGLFGAPSMLDRKAKGANDVKNISEKGGTTESHDLLQRLEGIVDPEDPRFEKLKTESL